MLLLLDDLIELFLALHLVHLVFVVRLLLQLLLLLGDALRGVVVDLSILGVEALSSHFLSTTTSGALVDVDFKHYFRIVRNFGHNVFFSIQLQVAVRGFRDKDLVDLEGHLLDGFCNSLAVYGKLRLNLSDYCRVHKASVYSDMDINFLTHDVEVLDVVDDLKSAISHPHRVMPIQKPNVNLLLG